MLTLESLNQGPALGRHLLIELYGCDAGILDDVEAIERHMIAGAQAAGATVLDRRFHRFEPQGISGFLVLAESHLSIHTWPEHRYAAVDLFTCSRSVRPENCLAALETALRSTSSAVLDLPRGHPEQIQAGCTSTLSAERRKAQ